MNDLLDNHPPERNCGNCMHHYKDGGDHVPYGSTYATLPEYDICEWCPEELDNLYLIKTPTPQQKVRIIELENEAKKLIDTYLDREDCPHWEPRPVKKSK